MPRSPTSRGIMRARAFILTVVVALVAASCGGDDDDASGDSAPAGSASDGAEETIAGSEPAASDAPAPTSSGSSETTDEVSSATTDAPSSDADIDLDGEITIAWTGVPRGLDPHLAQSSSEIPYVFQMYDRLTYIDENLEIQPMVAESWEFSPDGSTLTFTLRDDVTFNDGSPVNADAVKQSLERAKTIPNGTMAGFLTSIESIEAPSETELVLHVGASAASLPAALGTAAGSIINPVAMTDGRDLNLDPGPDSGSGPMVMESFTPSETATFVRADDEYWDPDANKLARLTMPRIVESGPRMAAYRSGDAQMINIKTDQLSEAEAVVSADEGAITEGALSLLHYALFIRNTRSEFDDVRVRQALNMAIDRDAISTGLMNDFCTSTEQMFPEGHPYHVDELEGVYAHDPEAARALLAEAGVPDGFTFESTVVSGLSPNNEMIQVVQGQLAEVGVNMSILPLANTEAGPRFAAGELDAFLHTFTGQPDASISVANHITGGQYNIVGEAVPEVNALAAQGTDQTLTQEERDEAYRELVTVVHDQALYVPICFAPTAFLSAPDVLNAETMSWQWSGIFDPRYLAVAAG